MIPLFLVLKTGRLFEVGPIKEEEGLVYTIRSI